MRKKKNVNSLSKSKVNCKVSSVKNLLQNLIPEQDWVIIDWNKDIDIIKGDICQYGRLFAKKRYRIAGEFIR